MIELILHALVFTNGTTKFSVIDMGDGAGYRVDVENPVGSIDSMFFTNEHEVAKMLLGFTPKVSASMLFRDQIDSLSSLATTIRSLKTLMFSV